MICRAIDEAEAVVMVPAVVAASAVWEARLVWLGRGVVEASVATTDVATSVAGAGTTGCRLTPLGWSEWARLATEREARAWLQRRVDEVRR